MIKLNNKVTELAFSDLDKVVGGGKIGDAAQTVRSGLSKAASDIGTAALVATIVPSPAAFNLPK